MPRLEAISYVNMHIRTSDQNPVLMDRLVLRPGREHTLILLKNGGGKTTLVRTELSVLFPRLRKSAIGANLADYFDERDGPAYIAFDFVEGGRERDPRHAHTYVIGALQATTGPDGGRDLERLWAIVPGFEAGAFDELPLCSVNAKGQYRSASLREFRAWAAGLANAQLIDRVGEVAEALAAVGISSDEFEMQALLNTSENGMDQYFAQYRTSKALFEQALMRVVERSVVTDAGDDWAFGPLRQVADLRSAQAGVEVRRRECSAYAEALGAASAAIAEHAEARQALTGVRVRVASAKLTAVALEDEQQVFRLEFQEEERRLEEAIGLNGHIAESQAFWEAADALEAARADEERASDALAQAGEACERARRLHGLYRAAELERRLEDPRGSLASVEARIASIENGDTDEARSTAEARSHALYATEAELAQARQAEAVARGSLEAAKEARREAERALREAGDARMGAERNHAEAELLHRQALEGLSMPREALGRLGIDAGIVRLTIEGFADDEGPARELERSRRQLASAQARAGTCEATLARAEAAERAAASALEAAAARRDGARERSQGLEATRHEARATLRRVHESFGFASVRTPGSNATAALNEAHTEAVRNCQAALTQARGDVASAREALALFERGIDRLDPFVARLVEEQGIVCKTARQMFDEADVDPLTYLSGAPWIADMLFADEENTRRLKDALSEAPADAGTIFVAIETGGSLDAALNEASATRMYATNVRTAAYADPRGYRRELEAALERASDRVHDLETRQRALDGASEALQAYASVLGRCASYDELAEAAQQAAKEAAAADAAWEEAERGHRRDQDALLRATDDADRARDALGAAQDVCDGLEALAAAIAAFNVRHEELLAAGEALEAARAQEMRAQDALDSARAALASATDVARDATEALRQRNELLGRLNPRPGEPREEDPEGRSAAVLKRAYDELLERLDAGLGHLRRLREEHLGTIETLSAQQGVILRDAGCDRSELSEFYRGCNLERLPEARQDFERADARRGEAESLWQERKVHRSRCQGTFESARDTLKKSGHDEPIERRRCMDVDTAAERWRLTKELGEARAGAAEADRQLSEIRQLKGRLDGLLASSAAQAFVATGKASPAALRGVPDLEQEYEDAREELRRTQGHLESARETLADAVRGLDGLSFSVPEDFAEHAQNVETLRQVERADSYESALRVAQGFREATESVEKSIAEMNRKLEDVDNRFGQVLDNLAADVRSAVEVLASLSRMCDINIETLDGRRHKAQFLKILIQSKDIVDSRRELEEPERFGELRDRLAAHLDRVVDGMIAGVGEGRIRESLALTRLVYVGLAGKESATVGIRFAICKEEEFRRNQSYSDSFFGSGAEGFVTKMVWFLAISRLTRQTELGKTAVDGSVIFMDNPFGTVSAAWAISYMKQVAERFGYQIIADTHIKMKEIAAYYPKVVSLAPVRRTTAGLRLMGYDDETTTQGVASVGVQHMSSFTTFTEQTRLDLDGD